MCNLDQSRLTYICRYWNFFNKEDAAGIIEKNVSCDFLCALSPSYFGLISLPARLPARSPLREGTRALEDGSEPAWCYRHVYLGGQADGSGGISNRGGVFA